METPVNRTRVQPAASVNHRSLDRISPVQRLFSGCVSALSNERIFMKHLRVLSSYTTSQLFISLSVKLVCSLGTLREVHSLLFLIKSDVFIH